MKTTKGNENFKGSDKMFIDKINKTKTLKKEENLKQKLESFSS